MGYHRPISSFNIGKQGGGSGEKVFRPEEIALVNFKENTNSFAGQFVGQNFLTS